MTEAIRGHLDLLLLAALRSGSAHGYAIIERLRDGSEGAFAFPEGTIYPALHRLERERLLSSSWTDASGRRRRVYSLTARGRKELALRTADWERFAGAVRLVIGGAT